MSQTHTESALIVLGRKVRLRNLPYFNAHDLMRWVPELATQDAADHVIVALSQLGYAEKFTSPGMWLLNTEGIEASRAARAQAAGKARGATLTNNNKKRDTGGSLHRRLWNLLRIRKALTTEDATSLLADAGEDTRSIQESIRKYLRHWRQSRPDVVQVSAKRINGFVRYVLVKDIGATPRPRTTSCTCSEGSEMTQSWPTKASPGSHCWTSAPVNPGPCAPTSRSGWASADPR